MDKMKKNISGIQNSIGLSQQKINNSKKKWSVEKRVLTVLLGVSVFLNLGLLIGIVNINEKLDAQSAIQADYQELSSQYNVLVSENVDIDKRLLDGQSLVDEGTELVNKMELDITQLEYEKDGLFQENKQLNDSVDILTGRISGLESQLQDIESKEQEVASTDSQSTNTSEDTISGTFTIGSTKDEVKNVMGTPTQILDFINNWGYENSTISFDENNLVSGWSNYSDNLKVR